jgi:hypothetical protein
MSNYIRIQAFDESESESESPTAHAKRLQNATVHVLLQEVRPLLRRGQSGRASSRTYTRDQIDFDLDEELFDDEELPQCDHDSESDYMHLPAEKREYSERILRAELSLRDTLLDLKKATVTEALTAAHVRAAISTSTLALILSLVSPIDLWYWERYW